MARFDFVSGSGEKSVSAPTSQYKNVTEFRGMDLDTLAKQYALHRQLNALDQGTPPGVLSPHGTSAEMAEQPPGLVNRLFGRLASF